MDFEKAIENILGKVMSGKAGDALQFSEALLYLTKAKATYIVTQGEIAQQEKAK
jgi:hypothetical protein